MKAGRPFRSYGSSYLRVLIRELSSKFADSGGLARAIDADHHDDAGLVSTQFQVCLRTATFSQQLLDSLLQLFADVIPALDLAAFDACPHRIHHFARRLGPKVY